MMPSFQPTTAPPMASIKYVLFCRATLILAQSWFSRTKLRSRPVTWLLFRMHGPSRPPAAIRQPVSPSKLPENNQTVIGNTSLIARMARRFWVNATRNFPCGKRPYLTGSSSVTPTAAALARFGSSDIGMYSPRRHSSPRLS